jgi:hypothetical protein
MKNRVDTIRLAVQSSIIGSTSDWAAINKEFLEVARLIRMQPLNRRNLLQILHMTRALDTTLKNLLIEKGVPLPAIPALDPYFKQLVNHSQSGFGTLPEGRRKFFKKRIINRRNSYMHQSGRFPSSREIEMLLSDMDACLSEILAL